MESLTVITQKKKEQKEELRKKIALLKSQLSDDEETLLAPHSPKSTNTGLLVPTTPSPRKKRKLEKPNRPPSRNANILVSKAQSTDTKQAVYVPPKVAPSNLVDKLSKLHSEKDGMSRAFAARRTSSFTETPPEITSEVGTSRRDEDLAIIESLEVGPADHKPLFDDPHFERVEPNSGIRLKSRILPHEDLQDHLRGRYYLSPSRLYSCISLLPDKTGYDVPVDGDWVTIAVVAERGPIKYTNPPVGINREQEAEENGEPSAGQGKNKGKSRGNKNASDAPNPRRRYVNVKLIDFGARTSSSSSTQGQIRGDAFLTLLLFEAEAVDVVTEEHGEKLAKPKKVYRGGSGGAFEVMAKLKEGDVIALLNPRIMKPFTNSSSSNPHPVHNILAVTPTNSNSITHIGRSLDLGMCTVQKRDGSMCGSWCDKRISNVCEWHVANAVQRRRAARPEFAIGTSGIANSTAANHNEKSGSSNSKYDPVRKTGLLPRSGVSPSAFGSRGDYEPEAGATYVLAGHVINSSNIVDTTHVSEQMGREGQARAQRAEVRRQEDEFLKRMLKKEKMQDSSSGHMKSVLAAREAVENTKQDKKVKESVIPKKRKLREEGDEEEESNDREEEQISTTRYRPEMIRTLGFDPVAMKLGPQRRNNTDVQKKLADLAALQKSREGKEVNLGSRPGPKIRSGVFKPTIEPARFKVVSEQSDTNELNADASGAGDAKMVDLDSSDED